MRVLEDLGELFLPSPRHRIVVEPFHEEREIIGLEVAEENLAPGIDRVGRDARVEKKLLELRPDRLVQTGVLVRLARLDSPDVADTLTAEPCSETGRLPLPGRAV